MKTVDLKVNGFIGIFHTSQITNDLQVVVDYLLYLSTFTSLED
jgi:hypothetical protein